jgi:hypothetical protein
MFNLKAELLWSTVPPEAKERVLGAVWCSQCRTSVQVVDYTGEARNGDLVLRGKCATCGGNVCRVLEISEAPEPQN